MTPKVEPGPGYKTRPGLEVEGGNPGAGVRWWEAAKNITLSGLSFRYVEPGSEFHRQAVELRYRVFFQPLGVPRESVLDHLEEKSLHLAGVWGEGIIGCGRLTVQEGWAQISQLVVEPGLQKQGLGSDLLRRLVQRAGELGVSGVFLNARVAYVPFYAGFGFLPVGGVFPSAKTGLPHQRMERPLP